MIHFTKVFLFFFSRHAFAARQTFNLKKIKFEYLKKIICTYSFKFGTVKMHYNKMHFFVHSFDLYNNVNGIYVFLAFYARSTKVGWYYKDLSWLRMKIMNLFCVE